MVKKLNRKSDLFLVKLSRLSYERPMNFVKHLYLLKYPVPLFNLAFQSSNSVNKTKMNYDDNDIKQVFYLRTQNYVYGYFIIINKILYIVFRGTRSIINWITNLTYDITDHGFHQGYINSFEKNIEPSFFKYLNKIKHKFSRIILTGHSAGAVYSAIASYKLGLQGYKPELIGFGCPRFCTKKTMRQFKKLVKMRFYVNDGDIIPKRPLGNFANNPIYKKMKCDYILDTIPAYIKCHANYLGIVFNGQKYYRMFHKVFVYRDNKTKYKTMKLKL